MDYFIGESSLIRKLGMLCRWMGCQRLGIPPDQIALDSVSNGSDIKNYKVVIQSLALLKKPDLHYYQVGNPHPQAIDALAASESGVENQVTLVGPRTDIADWLWACDIYVMPSIFEGYGLAAVEALASGCDCLFADCPGLADFKSMNLMALWMTPNTRNFAKGIDQLIIDPIPEDSLKENSRMVADLFSVKTRSKAYHDIWNEAKGSEAK